MARQRRSAAPSRPAQHTQTRPATTAAHAPAAHPPAHAPAPAPPAHAPVAAPQQPGMFAQMASTAAGVAVGSAVGHTLGAGITGLFSGGGSSTPAPAPAEQTAPQQYTSTQNFSSQQGGYAACEPDQKAFLRCLDQNSNDINACQFYLDMLKQCQASARTTLA